MKPAPFDHVRIDSPEEACDLLAEHGDDARVLAGGQSLMPMLNMRLAKPAVLLDISRCAALDYVRVEDGTLAIGAATTQAAIEWRPALATEVPLLAAALPAVAHFPIRNRGTVCGSLAHADPSAELPLCLAALDGEVVLRSRAGTRRLKAAQFQAGVLATACRADELLVEARFPLRSPDEACAFEEFSLRHGDYAIVAVAAVASPRGIRIAVGGVADRPVVADWPDLDDAALDTALNDLAWSLGARDEGEVSAKMRRHLVRGLGRRVVRRARPTAGGLS
ncbi:MAG: carbon monoxide dehydrogenase [Betaproteobacteria bacterium]|nr:carbon monoxide dehydrogenase [Betaproteobacteria bacterium]